MALRCDIRMAISRSRLWVDLYLFDQSRQLLGVADVVDAADATFVHPNSQDAIDLSLQTHK
jgi:hypothetical protein